MKDHIVVVRHDRSTLGNLVVVVELRQYVGRTLKSFPCLGKAWHGLGGLSPSVRRRLLSLSKALSYHGSFNQL